MASQAPDLSAIHWRKSRYSNGDGGSCVEVGGTTPTTAIVPVRDTKTAPSGPILTFPATQWTHFIEALHNGDLNA
ncbi:DUF397 domain-containing protein [Streptomyces smyrnaeus]|uniref:DUF397 domain-containing protein n=1 Tax=Streptomyces smyrnaeus TaxID=1387713 RepID=UPI003682EEAB